MSGFGYNFEVEDFHTYHVSEHGVLVHNANYGQMPDFIVTPEGTAIPSDIVKHNSNYNILEIETSSGRAVRTEDVIDDWNNFLGVNQTNIDPFTGARSQDRIWSLDGRRSIRFGGHELSSMGTTKAHYHKETWFIYYVLNELQRIQK